MIDESAGEDERLADLLFLDEDGADDDQVTNGVGCYAFVVPGFPTEEAAAEAARVYDHPLGLGAFTTWAVALVTLGSRPTPVSVSGRLLRCAECGTTEFDA